MLLQVQGPLAEAAARTAVQAWHGRDVVSSLGAVKLVRMLNLSGTRTSRAFKVNSPTGYALEFCSVTEYPLLSLKCMGW